MKEYPLTSVITLALVLLAIFLGFRAGGARPQCAGGLKCLARYSCYTLVRPTTTQTSVTKPFSRY